MKTNLLAAYADIVASLVLWRYWLFKALYEYRAEFRGARIGLLWPLVSLLVFAGVLASVWGLLLDERNMADYFMYLFSGLCVWQSISNTVQAGNFGLTRLVSSSGLPIAITIFERFARVFIQLAITLPFVLMTAAILSPVLFNFWLFLVLSLVSLFIWVLGVLIAVASLSSIWPDARFFINALMRLSFLATPIIWAPERLGIYAKYVVFNPFYLPLEFVRSSVLGDTILYSIWVSALVYSGGTLLIGFLIYAMCFTRLRSL